MPSTENPSSALPDSIVQSIAISNAKSIGAQPAILANLALANQIFNTNLQQQMALASQQALNQLVLAITAKCVSLICADGLSASGEGQDKIATVRELVGVLKTLQTPVPPAAAPAPSPAPKA